MPTGIYKHKPLFEEQKKKISKALKGRKKPPFSEEHKKNLSEVHKGKPSWNKGKKLPEISGENNPAKRPDVRKKISKALKGRIITWNDKVSKAKKGKSRTGNPENWKHTKETKGKIGEANKGRKQSKEHKRKRSIAMLGKNLGEKSVNWNPDREALKRNLRNDPEYKQWVIKVKKRDNNTCRFKNKDCSGYNIAHHIKSWSKYPKLRYKVNNGITLCQAHHPRKRAEEKRLIPIFEELVSVSS